MDKVSGPGLDAGPFIETEGPNKNKPLFQSLPAGWGPSMSWLGPMAVPYPQQHRSGSPGVTGCWLLVSETLGGAGSQSPWAPHPQLGWPQYPWSELDPWGSVIRQGDDVVLDALVLQLLDVFRHCLLCAKQTLGLGHGSISHRCDS